MDIKVSSYINKCINVAAEVAVTVGVEWKLNIILNSQLDTLCRWANVNNQCWREVCYFLGEGLLYQPFVW